ncbi:MAG TPA: 2'-5' RNA ligase family protein [Streptosporangiaceae bacterium]|nr:2'-5' RNA ligase family protein [Streptosporangiaceae bacterium]
MTHLPSQMANRWQGRAELSPEQGMLYWHILLGDSSEVRALAAIAQERLACFSGLHFTPKRWLHVTTLAVGLIEQFTETDIGNMTARARDFLSDIPPAKVILGKVLYHPEAIVLGVEPAGALDPVRDAVHAAVMNGGTERPGPWVPHVTLAYSTSVQPAAPIIAALGRELPAYDVSVSCVNLVVQEGAERLWKWRSVAEIPLGASGEGKS